MQLGASLGDGLHMLWEFDGWGLSAKVKRWSSDVAARVSIGQYNKLTMAYLRIQFGTDNRPSFSFSADAITWTAAHTSGYVQAHVNMFGYHIAVASRAVRVSL